MASQFYNESEPVNLGTNYEISIKDLVELISDLMGFDGEIVWEIDKPNGQLRRCLDTTRAQEKFGFVAQMEFKEGLQKTIEWYRQNAA
ncbi:GDP-L-fucose synthase [Microcystis aeruginosa NIES-4264]|nr:GDP-L-fucose synthase [Microcystis aeruginosa NIES-4264]